MSNEGERKQVVFLRRYKCYMQGEVAGFPSKEAERIVAAKFGRYVEKDSEDKESSSNSKRTKLKRTTYEDRQLRSESH